MIQDARPRWLQIHDEVLLRIQQQTWPPGHLLPPETELAEQFGSARATVNRALRELAEEGVLIRRRKSGTRVARLPTRQAKLPIPILRREIEAAGKIYSYQRILRRHRKLPTGVADTMGLPSQFRALEVLAIHRADQRPYVLEHRWINSEVVPEALEESFLEISANEWLIKHAAFSEGQLVLAATAADRRQSQWLETEPGTPLLTATRVTRDDAAAITWVRLSYHPQYRFQTQI